MNNSSLPKLCEDDSDCPGTLACYEELQWSDEPAFFGWKGTECDELGSAVSVSAYSPSSFVYEL
eukprot:maker-scaffold_2-snap-gene-11.53-mRNA-1 protein AED:0.44 eAED:0.74 QI:0/0/0/1/1/1/3/0/63